MGQHLKRQAKKRQKVEIAHRASIVLIHRRTFWSGNKRRYKNSIEIFVDHTTKIYTFSRTTKSFNVNVILSGDSVQMLRPSPTTLTVKCQCLHLDDSFDGSHFTSIPVKSTERIYQFKQSIESTRLALPKQIRWRRRLDRAHHQKMADGPRFEHQHTMSKGLSMVPWFAGHVPHRSSLAIHILLQWNSGSLHAVILLPVAWPNTLPRASTTVHFAFTQTVNCLSRSDSLHKQAVSAGAQSVESMDCSMQGFCFKVSWTLQSSVQLTAHVGTISVSFWAAVRPMMLLIPSITVDLFISSRLLEIRVLA